MSSADKDARRQQERVQKAAAYCADLLTAGWQDTVTERAADYVSEETWGKLLRGRRGRRCGALAQVAMDLLAGKQQVHHAFGFVVSRGIGLLGASEAAQDLAGELVAAIPLTPFDMKITAAARGVQVTGVLLCVMGGRDLMKCQCFTDLALAETKDRVKKILMTATTDWTKLHTFTPRVSGHHP